jgi:prepilin-type N-terminal cleavage/methylation domain-containing protein
MVRVKHHREGFTLVELAIVLVIIALIVAGVLVGQELVSQARIRKVMIQLTQHSQAVNTFYTKFNSVPGDFNNAFNAMPPLVAGTSCTNATKAAFADPGCNGNGNGLVNEVGEDLLFWAHLSYAALTAGTYIGTEGVAEVSVSTPAVIYIGGITSPWIGPHRGVIKALSTSYQTLNAPAPAAKLYWLLAAIDSTTTLPINPSFTSLEAFTIDNKMDDGNGGTGIVLANTAITGDYNDADDCRDAAGIYELTATISCLLKIRAQ